MRDFHDFPLSELHGRLPIVLVGGVNLVRCLGHAGIAAIVASADAQEPAFASRHCTARAILPALDRGSAAADALYAIGERLHRELGSRVPLMYGSDDGLRLVQTHRVRLAEHYLLLLNDPEVAEALIDKDRFQAFAEAHGLPVPTVLRWEGDGAGTVAGTPGPVLVKPRDKVDWYQSALRLEVFGDGKARIFESGAQAAHDPGVARHHAELLFQQYVPGGHDSQWSFHGLADGHGRVLACFAGRKIRTHPPLTGESAFIEIAHDASLETVGREVAARVPLKGLFKMDFKRDARDGRWYLLEINARCNLWQYLGACNGVNLMRAAYDYLVAGTLPEAANARTTYRWLALNLDWRGFRILAARGELSWARWLWSIAASRNIYSVFAWRDPGPWLALWRERFARRIHGGPGHVLAALRQWRSSAS